VLEGIRVLDLGTMITGPLAAMLLADMGAEVIKVEPPGGDPFRSFTPDGYSPQFIAYNRGKRSEVLDLRTAEGQGALRLELEKADVLIENYRPGTLARFGLPPEEIAASFPRLVHCSITGFGRYGPYASRPAYDGVAQSYAGTMSLFLDPASPQVGGPTIADNVTGYTAALGVLGALVKRGRTGRGCWVEVNMLEAMMAFTPDAFVVHDMTGEVPHHLSRVAASQTFVLRCGDDRLLTVHLSAPPKFWTGLLVALEAPELAHDPRFKARPSRVTNYLDLRAEFQERFIRRSRAEWLQRLTEQDVPHAPVLTIAEVSDDVQVRHLGAMIPLPVPAGGTVRSVAPPWRFNGRRAELQRRAPVLGEHTVERL